MRFVEKNFSVNKHDELSKCWQETVGAHKRRFEKLWTENGFSEDTARG